MVGLGHGGVGGGDEFFSVFIYVTGLFDFFKGKVMGMLVYFIRLSRVPRALYTHFLKNYKIVKIKINTFSSQFCSEFCADGALLPPMHKHSLITAYSEPILLAIIYVSWTEQD